ncbi:glycine oxidase ThiO [Methylomonas sp. MgM2]
MTLETDILIVGGGISGLLTARELRMAGREVTIIDKSRIGREASWAGGGILLPIYPWRQKKAISDLVINSLQRYPSLSRELDGATDIDPEWNPCGMLICKNPDYDVAIQWCESRHVAYRDAPPTLLKNLNTRFEQPLWLPDIAQARNPRLLKSLKAYLIQKGVRLIEQTEILGVDVEKRHLTSINMGRQSFRPKHVVICAGAWSANLLADWLPHASVQLPIQPVRGQMLLFDARPETLNYMILDGDHYLIPRRDGKILAGSTVEQVGFEKVTTQEAKETLHRFATELLPDLKNYPVCEHWAGLRPGTPDGVPYISFHPDVDNLSINAGHFRNGLVMGPASARLLADLILQRPTEVDPAPYSLHH